MEPLHDPKVTHAVDAYFAALTARDEVRWLGLFDAGAVCHQPVGSVPAEGTEGLREVWKMLTGPFESLRVEPRKAFYAGSGAAVHWAAVGRGLNGREVGFEGISVFEIGEDGRVQTVMGYWDPAAVLIDLAGD